MAARTGWIWALAILAVVCASTVAQQQTVEGRIAFPEGTVASDWRVAVAADAAPILTDALAAEAATPREDGAFAVDLPDGRPWYLLTFYRGRLAGDVAVLRDSLSSSPPEDLAVEPPSPREQLLVRLTDLATEPLDAPGVVHLYNGYGEVASAPTDGADITFDALPAGPYAAWFEPENPQVLSAPTVTFEVEPGAGAQVLEWPVGPACTITGAVRLRGGDPADGWTVAVRSGTRPDGGPRSAAYARGAQRCYWETVCGDAGRFELPGLAAGEVSLDFRQPGTDYAYHTVEGIIVSADSHYDLGVVTLPEASWSYPFDGESLTGWRPSYVTGQREVYVVDGQLVLAQGADMTGVVGDVAVPSMNYEITLEAMRVAGGDFFCGMTFPVEESAISLVMGGWGGGVTGLSSLNGADASENETSQWVNYANQRWYRVRVEVTENLIQVWLDGKRIIHVNTEGRHVGVRLEMERCRPFGFATWRTTGAIRDLRVRPLAVP